MPSETPPSQVKTLNCGSIEELQVYDAIIGGRCSVRDAEMRVFNTRYRFVHSRRRCLLTHRTQHRDTYLECLME